MFKIEKSSKSANSPRTIRFTDEMFERLNHIAKNQNISINSLVLQCCQYALDHMQDISIYDDHET